MRIKNMKKRILYTVCGLLLVLLLSAGALVVWAVYDELTEEPLIREVLLDKDVELDVQADNIQTLLGETEALLHFEDAGWTLGRADVRWEQNGACPMEYIAVYLFYRQKDGAYRQADGIETIHRQVYLLKENGRWIVVDASERNQEVYTDGDLSGSMLAELLRLAGEQMSLNYPEYDEYEAIMTAKEVSGTVYQKNEDGELYTIERLSFGVSGAGADYHLEEQ